MSTEPGGMNNSLVLQLLAIAHYLLVAPPCSETHYGS